MRRTGLALSLGACCTLALASAARGEGHEPVRVREAPACEASARPLRAEEITRLREMARTDGRLVRTSRPVRLYGYIKFDMAWDQHATNEGNYARWVESEAGRRNDDQFSVTVRETRFGLDLSGPDACGAKTSAKLEVDFYGGGTENNMQLKLRHAYVKLHWPCSGATLLAGQTWDVCHPLNMPTINYTVGWWVGNLGFRRPQLRLGRTLHLGRAVDLLLEGAAVRTVTGRDTPFTPTFEDTGEDAGFPSLQGRVALQADSVAVGLSGHWGQEEHDLDAVGTTRIFETWSLGADVSLPLGATWTLKGEVWLGRNLDAYLGGAGQGLSLAVPGAERVIDSRGGWLALTHRASSCVDLAAGGGFDDPEDGDLAAGMRSFNALGFANVWYRWRKRVSFGFELAYGFTDYRALRHGNSLRVQLAVKYEF